METTKILSETTKILDETTKISDENIKSLENSEETTKLSQDHKIIPLKIFTYEEKMKMCDKMGAKQRHLLITFGNIEKYNLPNLKDEKVAAQIISSINTEKRSVKFMTIAREEADETCKFPHFHIAMHIESKYAPKCGGIKKILYETFKTYHGNIDFSITNTTKYVSKAKYLICPTKDKIVDPKPYVYGETYEELLQRIEKSGLLEARKQEIAENWTTELIRAAQECDGDFVRFMGDDAVVELMWYKPYQVITCFKEIAKTPPEEPLENKVFPIEDYHQNAVDFFDDWFYREKMKGDCILMQSPPDMCKTNFAMSWAKSRNLKAWIAPASMREWDTWTSEYDIVIWDDMDENRSDLGGQRIAQLLDGAVTYLDVKYKPGKYVKVPRLIISINMGFNYQLAPPKFIARTMLFNVHQTLLKNESMMNKFPVKQVDFYGDMMLVDGEERSSVRPEFGPFMNIIDNI